MQGWRATMEDAHAAITDLDATTSFFGVYDGHGGKNCKFQHILKNEAYAAGDIGTSVQKAFFRMDERIRGQRGVVVVMNNLMIRRLKRVLTLTSLDQLVVAQPVL
ncbi:hypothetical protein OIU77_002430 [Salix suchowensis]|uniref:protein-serine/threonine phosphatase n=1 Tax=Salix suchowensis TaxID=1278906 RepID=A0ABQ9B7H3_9ROSI|nr:hypothetical protein OIU77_002430 [Salix suchowensis]